MASENGIGAAAIPAALAAAQLRELCFDQYLLLRSRESSFSLSGTTCILYKLTGPIGGRTIPSSNSSSIARARTTFFYKRSIR